MMMTDPKNKQKKMKVIEPRKIKMMEEGVIAFISAGVLKPRKNAVIESMFLSSLKEMDQEEEEEKAEAEAEKMMEQRKFRPKKNQDEFEDEEAIKSAMREFSKSNNLDNGINVQTVYTMLSELIDGIDIETCEKWVNEYDKDYNGIVDLSEFLQLILGKIILIDDTEEEVIEAFRIFDPEETGFIESTEMRKILMYLGDKLNDEEVNQFMKKADFDGEGFVNYEEFVKIMYPKNKKVN